MAAHNEANKGDYANTVLLPGDPQRAEWIAATFLEAPRCVNRRREMLGFTGSYRGKPVSVQSTGIGASSFLVYAHELLSDYGATTLIRIGTCGGLTERIGLRSLVISEAVRGEDAMSGQVFGLYGPDAGPDPVLLQRALGKVRDLGFDHHAGLTVSSDVYYHPAGTARLAALQATGALAVDMETSALYRLASHFGARALSIFTVVDNIVTGAEIDYSERQAVFTNMSRLALEVAVEG